MMGGPDFSVASCCIARAAWIKCDMICRANRQSGSGGCPWKHVPNPSMGIKRMEVYDPSGNGQRHLVRPTEPKPTISPPAFSNSQTFVPFRIESSTSEPRIHSATCRDQVSFPQENPIKRA